MISEIPASVPVMNSIASGGCPLCHATQSTLWATEYKFNCVRCNQCALLYVHPLPSKDHIDQAVMLGLHSDKALNTAGDELPSKLTQIKSIVRRICGEQVLDVVGSREPRHVAQFQRLVSNIFADVIGSRKPVTWLDVGAGFGEVVEAARSVAPAGSVIEGLEPMAKKAEAAKSRGIAMHIGYLDVIHQRYDIVSLIDVFSHIPDFKAFLAEVKGVLNPKGELFLKTGNGADIGPRNNFPGTLSLPDHLVFGGEAHVVRFLEESGFAIVSIRRERLDGIRYSIRNFVKWLVRFPVPLALPYTSPARVLFIRARLVGAGA